MIGPLFHKIQAFLYHVNMLTRLPRPFAADVTSSRDDPLFDALYIVLCSQASKVDYLRTSKPSGLPIGQVCLKIAADISGFHHVHHHHHQQIQSYALRTRHQTFRLQEHIDTLIILHQPTPLPCGNNLTHSTESAVRHRSLIIVSSSLSHVSDTIIPDPSIAVENKLWMKWIVESQCLG